MYYECCIDNVVATLKSLCQIYKVLSMSSYNVKCTTLEGVYVTIGNPVFCGVHFRGELQHGGDVIQQKIKYQPIRTREIGAVSLSDVLYILYVLSFLFNIYNATELKYRSSSATLFKKILWHRCFLVNFVKFPKNTFSYRTPLVAASENKFSKCISNKSWFSSVLSHRHSVPKIRILKTSVRLHL